MTIRSSREPQACEETKVIAELPYAHLRRSFTESTWNAHTRLASIAIASKAGRPSAHPKPELLCSRYPRPILMLYRSPPNHSERNTPFNCVHTYIGLRPLNILSAILFLSAGGECAAHCRNRPPSFRDSKRDSSQTPGLNEVPRLVLTALVALGLHSQRKVTDNCGGATSHFLQWTEDGALKFVTGPFNLSSSSSSTG